MAVATGCYQILPIDTGVFRIRWKYFVTTVTVAAFNQFAMNAFSVFQDELKLFFLDIFGYKFFLTVADQAVLCVDRFDIMG